nr:LysM peptidoglycan-binding domain-containing protein [uncultured Rothia sp.]
MVLHPAHARQSARIARGSSRRASAPQSSASPAPVRSVSPTAAAARPAAPSAPVNERSVSAHLSGQGKESSSRRAGLVPSAISGLRSLSSRLERFNPLRNFKGLPLLTLAALVVLGAITFLGPSFGPRVENASATQATVTVKHGETLWDIAQSVNPGGDVRDTVVRIMEMNSLTSTAVDAGQRLEVPKPRH